MEGSERQQRGDGSDEFHDPSDHIKVFLILFAIRVSDDPFSDGFRVYFVNDVSEEVNSESVGFVYIQMLVAFIQMKDETIDTVKHKSTDVKLRCDCLDSFGKQTGQFPESSTN